jgi:hypothetical protein
MFKLTVTMATLWQNDTFVEEFNTKEEAEQFMRDFAKKVLKWVTVTYEIE